MKTILITGASEGLGAELAQLFTDNGWNVVGISRTKPSNLNIQYIEADLTQEEIEKVAQEVRSNYSDFTALINCAGTLNIEKLENLSYKKTEGLLKLNLVAPMLLISKLKDLIVKNEADIVNIGSTIAFKAYEEQTAYGSSKWGLRGLNENLRLEFKGTKVRIISFNPGGFQSKIFEKATGTKVDLSKFMDPRYLADVIGYILNLPKNMEVSEIVINRK